MTTDRTSRVSSLPTLRRFAVAAAISTCTLVIAACGAGSNAAPAASQLAARTSASAIAQSSPLGAETRVNTFTAGDQENPATAMDASGNYVVVWDSVGQDGSLDGIYGQRFSSTGLPVGSEFQVNTFTPNRQFSPAVTMLPNGNFVVVWESDNEKGDTSITIEARIFAADGSPLTGELQLNKSHYFPTTAGVSVASDANGNFVVGWTEQNRGAGVGFDLYWVKACVYNSSGSPLFSPVVVAFGDNAQLRVPVVAMNATGDWAIAWVQTDNSIYARHYKPNAKAQGGAFRVDVANASLPAVDRPAIAMDGAGNFTIAWEAFHADQSTAGIQVQRFNAAGTAQGAAFVAGSGAGGNLQLNPSIGMDTNGDFVIAAHSDGIYAQRYAAGGTAVGSEFRVNSSTTHNTQLFASVGMNGTGNFVIAWQNFGQDGSGRGVYAQLYTGP